MDDEEEWDDGIMEHDERLMAELGVPVRGCVVGLWSQESCWVRGHFRYFIDISGKYTGPMDKRELREKVKVLRVNGWKGWLK